MNLEERRKQQAHDEFDRLHREGADKFDMLWLHANSLVAQHSHQEYVPTDYAGDIDIRIKALLSNVAWSMAELMEQHGRQVEELKAEIDRLRTETQVGNDDHVIGQPISKHTIKLKIRSVTEGEPIMSANLPDDLAELPDAQ